MLIRLAGVRAALATGGALTLLACERSPWAGGDDPLLPLAQAWSRGDCEEVVALAPGFTTPSSRRLRAASLWYGACLSELGRNDDALVVLDGLLLGSDGAACVTPGCLDADDTTPEALFWRGKAASRWDDDAGATEAWSTLDRDWPRADPTPEARLALAALWAPVDEAAAEGVLRRLIADAPGSVRRDDAEFALVRLPADAGRYADGIAALSAIATGPFADDARYAVGRALEGQGALGDSAALEQADALFRRFPHDFPESSKRDDAAYRLVRIAWARAEASGDYAALDAAVAAFLETPASPSLVAAARYWRGRALVERGADPAAIEELGPAIETPNGAYRDDASYYRGRAWYRLADEDSTGAYRAARADFDRVLEVFPNSIKADDASYYAGRCDEALGDSVSAEARYRELATWESPWADDAAYRWASLARASGDCASLAQAAETLQAIAGAPAAEVNAVTAWSAQCVR